jgi:hypothetical protein
MRIWLHYSTKANEAQRRALTRWRHIAAVTGAGTQKTEHLDDDKGGTIGKEAENEDVNASNEIGSEHASENIDEEEEDMSISMPNSSERTTQKLLDSTIEKKGTQLFELLRDSLQLGHKPISSAQERQIKQTLQQICASIALEIINIYLNN